MIDPTPPATTDIFGVRLRPLQRLPKPSNLVTADDSIDFFAGTAGAFGPFSLVQEADLTEAAASAVTEDPQTGRPVIAASRLGKGLVFRFGVPELATHLSARANDPEHHRPAGPHMDAPVPLILAALLAAGALVARAPRARAAAMLGALVLAPVILGFHIADSDQVQPLRDHPSLAVAGAVGAVVALAVLALLFDRRPAWLPVAAAATLPFRVPIASGGSTANLLVPLYLVVAAGAAAYALPRLAGRERPEGGRPPGALEWALAASLALYGIQASYSADFGHALENVVFFYVPFALLFALVARVAWTPRLARVCLGVLVVLALALVGRGLRRVRDAPPVPQPEGHRLQPARGLLPGQLAVLRPQHLRALPGHRDAPARRDGCCGPGASARSWPGRCCSRCCGAGWC